MANDEESFVDYPYESLIGFEKECQDFLQMIQEDGDSALVNFPTLDSFDSNDLSNSTHSSLLSVAEMSASQSFLGCSTSLQAALFQSSQDEAQCFIENQADVWEAAVCPYQACEGMLVEAEKLSSMAAMDSQPGSYVSLMNISMGQEDWIGGLEAAQPASASRPAKGHTAKPVSRRRRAAKPGGKIGRPRKDPRHACIRIFKETLEKGGLLLPQAKSKQVNPAMPEFSLPTLPPCNS